MAKTFFLTEPVSGICELEVGKWYVFNEGTFTASTARFKEIVNCLQIWVSKYQWHDTGAGCKSRKTHLYDENELLSVRLATEEEINKVIGG